MPEEPGAHIAVEQGEVTLGRLDERPAPRAVQGQCRR